MHTRLIEKNIFTASCARDVEDAELIYLFTFCGPVVAKAMPRQGGQKVKNNSPSGAKSHSLNVLTLIFTKRPVGAAFSRDYCAGRAFDPAYPGINRCGIIKVLI
jgi:hypothetical protein